MDKMHVGMSLEDLAHLGGGVVGYVREIENKEAVRLLGSRVTVAPTAKLFCLYNADGTPISISGSREAALNAAQEHELLPASLH